MKNLKFLLPILILALVFSCKDSKEKENVVEEEVTKEVAKAEPQENLPDWQYVGYKIVHHMTAQIKHVDEFGFNIFDHPPIADYQSFVITPALDHIYSKAVADLRNGFVVVNTPARDKRYSSLEVFDMEHHAIYAEVTGPEAQQYVIAHVDYKGDLPEGKPVIRTNAMFPFVFLRTQSFEITGEKKADDIRRTASIEGTAGEKDVVDIEDTRAIIKYVIDNNNSYSETETLMAEAVKGYTPEVHATTFENV